MGGSLENNTQTTMERLHALSQSSEWQQSQWQLMLDLGLPDKKHEDWKYTSLDKFLNLPLCAASNQCLDNLSYEGLSLGLDCYRLVFFDGHYLLRSSDWIPKVKVTSLSSMDESASVPLSQAVNAEAMSLLVDATASSGVMIEVEAGHKLDKPIYLFHINSGSYGEVASYRHHLKLGRLSQCEIIEHHVSLDQGGGISFCRFTMQVEQCAFLNHSKLIEEGAAQQHFAHNDITVGRDGFASSTVMMFAGDLIRHQTSSVLTKENGRIEMNSLAIPIGSQVFDSRTYLRHKSAHCTSEQLHKVIANDQSTGVFNGMIYVDKGAIKTDGQMDSHNLILGSKAQVNTKPQLEIYADDVKCSHGATTGQLDKEQIGYLQARGIKKQKAEQMLMFAFAAHASEKISNAYVRDYAENRIKTLMARSQSDE